MSKKRTRALHFEVALSLIDAQRTQDEALDSLGGLGVILPNTVSVDLVDIALDLLGIPPDNTLEMLDKYGDDWHNAKESYCRDWAAELWDNTIGKGGSSAGFLVAVQHEANEWKEKNK